MAIPTLKSGATSLASRSKAGSKIAENYKLIPTAGWPGYFLVGKILAYQLEEKRSESRLYRRGVIVEYFGSYSTLLPIKTYSGRGCSHLKGEQRMHSAIYVGSCAPSTEQEPSLRVAIQASRLDTENSANPRINYNGRFNLSHTERVREVGEVSGRHLQVLLGQYREVHGIVQEGTYVEVEEDSFTEVEEDSFAEVEDDTFVPAQEDTSAPPSKLPDAPHVKLPPCVHVPNKLPEDRKESGPQRKASESSANSACSQTSDLVASRLPEDNPQAPKQPKAIKSAINPPTPPEKPVGPSGAPPPSRNKEPTPPPPALNESSNSHSLQENSAGIPKTPQNDLQSRPTTLPLIIEGSIPVPSAGPPPKPEPPVKTAESALSIEALPEATTPPTTAGPTPLPEGDHVIPTEAIGPVHDTASKEVTGPTPLSVSRAVNTAPAPQTVTVDVQSFSQMMVSMVEFQKENMRQIQEAISAMRALATKQEMRYTFESMTPAVPMQEMVASVHVPEVPPPPAYTNLPQAIDANLEQDSEKEAPSPSAAAKNKQRAVDDIPPFAPMPPYPSLGDEPEHRYGGHHHHPATAHDPACCCYERTHSTNEQSIYSAESSNDASLKPYTRSPPTSSFHRSIWLQDEGLKSKIMVWALVDTGADDNFISEKVLQRLDAKVYPYHGQVTYGNGQTQESHGAVWLHFGLNSKPHRWEDRFIVSAGLPYDVVFGRDVITRLKFFLVNKEMLILAHSKNGKPTEEAVREAERQAEEHDRQVEEQNEREREETRTRRSAQAQQKPRA